MKSDLQISSFPSSAPPNNVPFRLTGSPLASTSGGPSPRRNHSWYAALNDLQHGVSLPHPILARNAGFFHA